MKLLLQRRIKDGQPMMGFNIDPRDGKGKCVNLTWRRILQGPFILGSALNLKPNQYRVNLWRGSRKITKTLHLAGKSLEMRHDP